MANKSVKKEFKGNNPNGKGMEPKKGYNPKNWYANFGKINWHHKPELRGSVTKSHS